MIAALTVLLWLRRTTCRSARRHTVRAKCRYADASVSPWQDELTQWGQLLLEAVNRLFHRGDVPLLDALELGGAFGGRRQLRADVEQLVLNALQQGVQFGLVVQVAARDAQRGVQFVHSAVSLHARVVFGHALPAD
jgi:hypothetical protein